MKLAQLPLKNQECKAVQKASLSPFISLSFLHWEVKAIVLEASRSWPVFYTNQRVS